MIRSCTAGLTLACLQLACTERGAAEMDRDSDADTSDSDASSSSSSGPRPEPACGADGRHAGTAFIATNDDALALRGCTTIDGDLIIDPCPECEGDPCGACSPADALTSLQGLEDLRDVTGTLQIGWDLNRFEDDDEWRGPTALSSLAPLSGLERVGGDLWLAAAPSVTEADFSSLRTVGGDVVSAHSFGSEARFPRLATAQSLIFVGRAWSEFSAPSLQSVDGVSLTDTDITSLSGLAELDAIETSLSLSRNRLLANVPFGALPQLQSVGLSEVPLISGVDLSAAHPRSSRIQRCASVAVVDGGGIESMDLLWLVDSPIVEASFTDLQSVDDSLWIVQTSLSSLEGFSAVQSIGARLEIVQNPNLCQSEALAFAERFEGIDWVTVEDNADC
ncbi:MAG: hypothetical protein ACE37F_32900 [Nannocystaceae bacterium]|nr:hypothetical protein [bacterium]